MTPSARLFALTAVVLAAVAASGCESYEKPNAPFPEFQAVALDGSRLDLASIKGKPWVINVWMPG